MHIHKRKNKSIPKLTMCRQTMKEENLKKYMTNFKSRVTCPKCKKEMNQK